MWSAILADARHGHRGLWLFSLVCLACAVLTGLAALVDGRLVTGAPVWLKPLKFFVSSAVYTATFSWYLAQPAAATAARGLVAWIGTAVWVLLAGELVLIVVQAARGVPSHFNVTTPVDAAVFAVMGVAIAALSLLHMLLWIWLLRASPRDRVRLAACRWGAGLALGGLVTGALMLGPTPAQRAAQIAGRAQRSGAHAVGVPDGGPGWPVLDWSREGGDRRVAHFVGLHAMQALPLVLLVLPATMQERARIAAVRATGVAYGLFTLLLVEQASQARPVLHPGSRLGVAMLAVLAAWLAVVYLLRTRAVPRVA